MAHPWDTYVIGGLDVPRFLLLRENFCTNPNFMSNLNGWTIATGTLTRVEQLSANYQYMGFFELTDTSDYAEYSYNYGSSIANKTFFAVMNIKSSAPFSIVFNGDIEFGSTAFTEDGRCFIIATATGVTGNNISIRIYGEDVYIDSVYFSEVLNDIELPQPHDSGMLKFEKETSGTGQLWTHKNIEYNVKWKAIYASNYEYLSVASEKFRQLISECQNIFCIPHKDVQWGFLGIWSDDKYERNYSFEKYYGHSGNIVIKGIDYVNSVDEVIEVIYYQLLISSFMPSGTVEKATGTLTIEKLMFDSDETTPILDSDIMFTAVIDGDDGYHNEVLYSVNTPAVVTDLTLDVTYTVTDDNNGGSYGANPSVPVSGAVTLTIFNDTGTIVNSCYRILAEQIVTFNSNGNFNWENVGSPAAVELLVVAGGASGGGNRGGGGGAGGYIYNASYSIDEGADVVDGNIAVVIGAGGVGTTGNGQNGGNSSFGSQIAVGGGAGKIIVQSGVSGGSGGGAGSNGSGIKTLGGNPTVGQGYKGGDSYGAVDNPRSSGGGGGAGGAGVNGTSRPDGGAGVSNSISGVAVIYCAGGGGGDAGIDRSSTGKGLGGSSGAGGDGGGKLTTDRDGTNATTPGSGGGGGGYNTVDGKAGNGANGIVIIKYIGLSPF